MKALKNESACYTGKITAAITECYQAGAEPSDAELMSLYSFIGQSICEQGEKAYVVHLAQSLAEQFPQMKGFSPRNLRRMRDFYRTYENSPLLMTQAQTLNWTQNTIILECCETNEQRAFYLNLAAEQKLSKLALMDAIKKDAFSAPTTEETAIPNVQAAAAPVCDSMGGEGVDTTSSEKPQCGAFLPACEPLHQGGGSPVHIATAFYPGIPLCMASLTENTKPPDKVPRFPSHDKKKNAPPYGRTLHWRNSRLPCPMSAAA